VSQPPPEMSNLPVLRSVTKALIPFVLLFALYVQFHGDFGPGGGFQAGVIFAAGFIVYGLIFGRTALLRVTRPAVIEVFIALGLLLYGGTGLYALTQGGQFLDYDTLDPAHPAHGPHLGIFLVELGVGITVAAVMLTIYLAFSGRGKIADPDPDEEAT